MKQQARSYDAPRRRVAAEATRVAVASAARRLFAARGWSATTIREIAREAEVSEPTVYNLYAGKEGLALALLEALESDADVRQARGQVQQAAGDPRAQLAALVAFDRRLFERGGDLIIMMRDAGRVVPELAGIYSEGRNRGRSAQRFVFGSWPADTLRSDLDVDTAGDVYASVASVDAYRTLVDERGWTADRIQEWWTDSLSRLLLAP